MIITIKKAFFQTEERIAVFIPKDDDLIKKIKQIPDRRWSGVHQCWHCPYLKENWRIFKSIFQKFEFAIDDKTEPMEIPTSEMMPPVTNQSNQKIIIPSENIPLSVPTKLDDTPPALSIQYVIPNNKIVVQIAPFWKGKLSVDMPYRPEWVAKIRTIDGKQWHPEHKCWSLPHSPLVLDLLKKHFGEYLHFHLVEQNAHETNKNIHHVLKPKVDTSPTYQHEVTKLIEQMMLKRMSVTTIKTYKNCFAQFLLYYDDIHPKDITKEQIIQYMLHRIRVDKISESVQNTFINGIKFYYEQVVGRDRTLYDIQRPKRPFQLPNVLSEIEIINVLNAVENIKHKCILMGIYSGGLRLSEVINLRLVDVRKDQNAMFIKGGKGKKDRYTLLSPMFLSHLEIYLLHYHPTHWVFEGQDGGQYAARSVQNILRAAVEKSGVNPYATVHTLRHSFATHLVERGENLLVVQQLLGHESPETTPIYVHLSGEQLRRTQSPLDKLKF